MNEKDIEQEVNEELQKKSRELIKDIFREANTLPKKPAGEKENLDIIKHSIKRLATHQIILEDKVKGTNCWLFVLSAIMAIGAIFSILSYFKK